MVIAVRLRFSRICLFCVLGAFVLACQLQLDQRAGSVRSVVAWGMCALLSVQASLVFYGTYFLYSWDIVEPLTYLLGACDVCAAYAFHAATTSDYSPSEPRNDEPRDSRTRPHKDSAVLCKLLVLTAGSVPS